MGDMVAGMEDIAVGYMANATLLQLEIPKIKMITTHPTMALAAVVAKMSVVLAMMPMAARIFIQTTITFYPCHMMHKGHIQEDRCHLILTKIRNPTCHKPWACDQK
eukprot:510647-Ditylum_brightwellii.AAC.1